MNERICQVISAMAHIFSVLLCVFVFYLCQPGTSLFSWHPTFMVIGFGFFMFEAILMFSPHSSLMNNTDRKTKVKYHWILQVIAVVCALLGFSAIYVNKNLGNKNHFKSRHGLFGLVAVIMASFQVVAGFSLIYDKLSFLNPLGTSLAIRKRVHAMYGALVFVVALCAMFLSLFSNFILSTTGPVMWYILLALMTMLTSVVVNQVANAYIFNH